MKTTNKPTRPGQSVRKLLPMSADMTYAAALYLLLCMRPQRTRTELLSYFAPGERLEAGDALNEMQDLGVVLEESGRYWLREAEGLTN